MKSSTLQTTSTSTSTTRRPFRVGYRRRSSTTTTTIPRTETDGTFSTLAVPTPTTRAPRVTKPKRRIALPGRYSATTTTTTAKPVESQVTSSQSPPRFINRFKLYSRKPYQRTTTEKTVDQTSDSTNQQVLNKRNESLSTTTELVTRKIQQPIPLAKPSRKRPQILRLTSRYSTSTTSTTQKPVTTTTTKVLRTKAYTRKKTIAIAVPFLSLDPQTVEVYSNPHQIIAQDHQGLPLLRQVPTITAQDFVSRYVTTPSVVTVASTRSKSRFTTEPPLIVITPSPQITVSRRKPTKTFQKITLQTENTNLQPIRDYDYYDGIEASIVGKIPEHSKVLLHANGIIECLDQGNFPHPLSCKKFIYCAKMNSDKIVGWEYTCSNNLSFDPIGGMCNWSAGLGCNET